MPEAAIAEPPETTATIHPELLKLFEVKVADEPEIEARAPVTPIEPTEKEKPAVTTTEEKKPDTAKPESRLAPDFAAIEKKPDTAEPDADLVELDKAIKEAPSEKARVDLKKFRDQLAGLKEENRTLKSKPAVLPEDAATKQLYETVKKERDELLEKVERTNLFESPKFQKEHLVPRQKQFERLQGLVQQAGGDPAGLQRAISLVGKSRIEALDEIRREIGSDMLKGQFDRLVEDIDAKTQEINEKVRNAKQTAQELQQSELLTREGQHAEAVKQFEGLLAYAHRDMAENIAPELFTKVDDPNFAWWNEAMERDDQVAREILLDSTPQKAAFAAKFASKFGTVLEMWRAERAANKAKDAEIAALKGAEPTLAAERQVTKVDTEAADSGSIIERLRFGAYKK